VCLYVRRVVFYLQFFSDPRSWWLRGASFVFHQKSPTFCHYCLVILYWRFSILVNCWLLCGMNWWLVDNFIDGYLVKVSGLNVYMNNCWWMWSDGHYCNNRCMCVCYYLMWTLFLINCLLIKYPWKQDCSWIIDLKCRHIYCIHCTWNVVLQFCVWF